MTSRHFGRNGLAPPVSLGPDETRRVVPVPPPRFPSWRQSLAAIAFALVVVGVVVATVPR